MLGKQKGPAAPASAHGTNCKNSTSDRDNSTEVPRRARPNRAAERRARDERRERLPLLLAELDAFLVRTGMSASRLGALAGVGQPGVPRIAARSTVPTLATMNRLEAFMRTYCADAHQADSANADGVPQ
jgi:hypothetical protein